MNQQDRDRYFALMVRHCAALQRGDSEVEESTAQALDALWKAHGNEAEAEWKQACLWVADCVSRWPREDAHAAAEVGPGTQGQPQVQVGA